MQMRIIVIDLDTELLRQQRLALDTLMGKKTVIKALTVEQQLALEGIRNGLDEIQDQIDGKPTTTLSFVDQAHFNRLSNGWLKNRRKNIGALTRIREAQAAARKRNEST